MRVVSVQRSEVVYRLATRNYHADRSTLACVRLESPCSICTMRATRGCTHEREGVGGSTINQNSLADHFSAPTVHNRRPGILEGKR